MTGEIIPQLPQVQDREGIQILMIKPDAYQKNNFCAEAAHNILIGMGDVLVRHITPGFYRSPLGENSASWALQKWPDLPTVAPELRDRTVISLEALRSQIPQHGYPLELVPFTDAMVEALQYQRLGEVNCVLQEPQIRRLYPYLNEVCEPEVELAKRSVIDAMVGNKLRFSFLKGDLGQKYLKVMQFILRKNLRDYTRTITNPSESILHVPDIGQQTSDTFAILDEYFSLNSK